MVEVRSAKSNLDGLHRPVWQTATAHPSPLPLPQWLGISAGSAFILEHPFHSLLLHHCPPYGERDAIFRSEAELYIRLAPMAYPGAGGGEGAADGEDATAPSHRHSTHYVCCEGGGVAAFIADVGDEQSRSCLITSRAT